MSESLGFIEITILDHDSGYKCDIKLPKSYFSAEDTYINLDLPTFEVPIKSYKVNKNHESMMVYGVLTISGRMSIE